MSKNTLQESIPSSYIISYQEALEQDALKLYNQQIAYGTRRVYESDWRLFETWCTNNKYLAEDATPAIIALFLTSQFQARFHPTTINRRLAAIKFWFMTHNKTSPTNDDRVRAVMKGIRRDKNAPKSRITKATLKELIKKMVDLCPTNTIRGIRDRALLLLSFCGGYRRSELVAIDIEDITFHPGKGMDIYHRFSKSDQEGKGDIKPIAIAKKQFQYCPIAAVKKWIEVAKIKDGALFRGITKDDKIKKNRMTSGVIYDLIKKLTVRLGYDYHEYSPHSLRSGFTTQALRNNARIDKIPSVTFHKNLRSLDSYIKHEDRYEDHPRENFF